MLPKTERKVVIEGNPYERGYERMGVDHCEFPRSEEEVEMMFQGFLKQSNMTEEQLPKVYAPQIRGDVYKAAFYRGAVDG